MAMQTKRKGQAMLLSVLALGGAILGATAIAGLLMLNQIRAATNAQHSAQAVFAADTGVEWAKYVYYCQFSTSTASNYCPNASQVPPPMLTGGAVTSTCYSVGNTSTPCYATTTIGEQNQAVYGITIGQSLETARAFLVDITGATTSVP